MAAGGVVLAVLAVVLSVLLAIPSFVAAVILSILGLAGILVSLGVTLLVGQRLAPWLLAIARGQELGQMEAWRLTAGLNRPLLVAAVLIALLAVLVESVGLVVLVGLGLIVGAVPVVGPPLSFALALAVGTLTGTFSLGVSTIFTAYLYWR